MVLLGALVVASAAAEDQQAYTEAEGAYPDNAGTATSQASVAQTREALEGSVPVQLTEQAPDSNAAAELPHRDLSRTEALELATAVFGLQLEGEAGVIGQLDPTRFLSDYAAIVPPAQLTESGETSAAEGASTVDPQSAFIVESSLPLRTEAADGSKDPVDLGLHSSETELTPENPLVEVGIPRELSQGISLPDVGVGVKLAEAPADRQVTDVEGDFGFYPNVAENTDLVIAPVPTGVETLTDIRSAEAPKSQTFELSMPQGADLQETPEGGAEVASAGRTLVNIPAPSAIDAAGATVPVNLEVGGRSITLTAETSSDTAYPVLLDPAFLNEEFNWWLHHDSLSGWSGGTSAPSYQPVPYAFFWGGNYPGPDLTSGFPGAAPYGTGATWIHTVPRYFQDMNDFGTPPTSWIHELFAEGVMFLNHGNSSAWPALILGLVDPNNGWANYGVHYGYEGDMTSLTNTFAFYNQNASQQEQKGTKYAEMALVTYEAEASAKLRDTYIGNAMVVISDEDAPEVKKLESPQQWMNMTPLPIPYRFEDSGVGVRSATLSGPDGSFHAGWGRDLLCAGTNVDPCPRKVDSSEPGRLPLNYDPSELPTGIDKLTASVGDATWASGHVTAQTVKVRVDHVAPTLSIGGSLTEQGAVGTSKPQYTLKYHAADGSEEPPTFISSFGSEGTAAGQFKHPADVAIDANANVWVSDQNNNRIERQNEKGEVATFGSFGASAGQFNHPTGLDVDSAGNVWIADTGNNRVEELNAKGEVLRLFGSAGSTNGKFSAPQGITVGGGNVWVADTGNNRIEEFSSTGTFLGAFGYKGSGSGQLSEPTALDLGPGGNIWVADAGNNRIEEFSESGEFLATYGTLGSANGQLNHPAAIDVDTWGNVWVGDQGNGRVEQFSERGEYLGKFAGAGADGTTQFNFAAPIGVATNNAGKLWVTEPGKNRVENWNAPQATQSGVRSISVKIDGRVVHEPKLACETGACPLNGEWTLQSGEYSAGAHVVEVLATDGVGLTDTKKLNINLNPPPPTLAVSGTMTEQGSLGTTLPRYTLKLSGASEEGTGEPPVTAPSYRSSFGSPGSGTGQLNHPGGMAIDAAGNIWVADKNNNRIEKFNPRGEYVTSFGSFGVGNGQLNGPTAVAVDAKGNLWVADTGNGRIEKFSQKGEYLNKLGSIGTGDGQFTAPGPEGIALDAKGNIWVSDTYGSRLEEFNVIGGFYRSIGSRGGGNGQLSEPSALAIAANGNAWVTDWADQRIEVYNEVGEYVRQFGTEGSGERQFKHPNAIAIDLSGNVWVADQNNERIQEFNQSGRYLGQFGSGGSGPGQFSFVSPMGIAADLQGNLWVSDTANNRVQRWREATRSLAKAEITLDGQQVESSEVSCTTESCPTTLEWSLAAASYPIGPHVVTAKITDGFGRTTSRTVNVETHSDTTKPALEVGGELANAPEGWVQQESYGFHASATDAGGYGVTSLAVKIDGATVASSIQTCAAGGCEASITKSIDMAPYAGGSHPAEVVAVDGAGNSSVRRWTINVDPEGHISTAEATDTVEAVEATSDANLVGESEEEEGIEGSAPGLGIESNEGQLEATGTHVPLTINPEPGGGFTAEVPEASAFEVCASGDGVETEVSEAEQGAAKEAEEIEEDEVSPGACQLSEPEGNEEGMDRVAVVPLDVKEGAGTGNLVEENAVISANSQFSADTVIRPLSDGGMVFAAIRDESAPERYSWRVELSHDQELRLLDDQHVQVYYNDSTPAFSITAEPAHDAVGTTVPTTLSVEGGNIVTLTVHYKAGHDEGQPFVYPIIGGAGWEGGFQTTVIDLAEPEPEEEPQEELSEADTGGALSIAIAAYGAPEPDSPLSVDARAQPSSEESHHRHFKFSYCWPHHIPGDIFPPGQFDPTFGTEKRVNNQEITKVASECHRAAFKGIFWGVSVHGVYHYKIHHWVRVDPDLVSCDHWGEEQPKLDHCKLATSERVAGPLSVWGEYRFHLLRGGWIWETRATCFLWGGRIYPRKPNEDGSPYERPAIFEPTAIIPNSGECDWRSLERDKEVWVTQ